MWSLSQSLNCACNVKATIDSMYVNACFSKTLFIRTRSGQIGLRSIICPHLSYRLRSCPSFYDIKQPLVIMSGSIFSFGVAKWQYLVFL